MVISFLIIAHERYMSDKILTISIAAYNVQDYISNTIESLLIENIEDLEILIIDDGGTDDTVKIAEKYAKKFPHVIKVVKKTNGGYGSTINYGIDHATGKYFKQLDGDDWFDQDGLLALLKLLRENDADVFYTPYIFFDLKKQMKEKKDAFRSDLEGKYDINQVINKNLYWLNMYTLTYRTEILRESNIRLIEKCLYTDAIYALLPITIAQNIYISHQVVYVYRYGRDEQSMSKISRLTHYNDHVKVSLFIMQFYSDNKNKFTPEMKEYCQYYVSYQLAMTACRYLFLIKKGKKILDDFLSGIQSIDEELYRHMINKRKALKLYILMRKRGYTIIHLYCSWKD